MMPYNNFLHVLPAHSDHPFLILSIYTFTVVFCSPAVLQCDGNQLVVHNAIVFNLGDFFFWNLCGQVQVSSTKACVFHKDLPWSWAILLQLKSLVMNMVISIEYLLKLYIYPALIFPLYQTQFILLIFLKCLLLSREQDCNCSSICFYSVLFGLGKWKHFIYWEYERGWTSGVDIPKVEYYIHISYQSRYQKTFLIGIVVI